MGIEAGSSTYYQAKRGIVQDGLVLHLDAGVKESYGGAGSTIRDISGNGNNGTLYNGPAFARTQQKPSLKFDGSNDYIGIPSPSNRFNWTPSGVGMNYMTIDLWVKTTDTGGWIVSKPWNGNGQYNFGITYSNFFFAASTGKTVSFSRSIATGNWENVTCVANPTQIAAYLNGVINASFVDHNITTNSPVSAIGSQVLTVMTVYPYGQGMGNTPGHAIDGNVGSFKVYNRVLSADEISQNYNATRHRFGV